MNQERKMVRINEIPGLGHNGDLIRSSCKRGSERDPDTRAEGSIGTDEESI